MGTLDRPSIPDIPGQDIFKGGAFHSARWESSTNISWENVVVLGNGASATQFMPRLVKQVAPKRNVTQLVKSAHWWTKL
jgi:cation diffusion facilitator CzcD-associated flavoprotein CzcO